jgi:hypothetical protein
MFKRVKFPNRFSIWKLLFLNYDRTNIIEVMLSALYDNIFIFSVNTKVKSGMLTNHNSSSLPEFMYYNSKSVIMAYNNHVEGSLV